MASVTVTINARDNMSAVIAGIQGQLNHLQQQANVNLGAGMRDTMRDTMNYTTRLYEGMLNNLGNKLFNAFTSQLKSAYNEIKAIDDELVVVRRVTGKTNAELAGMAKNANVVAQKYGISASKYLEGVANFTRAGYGDQAEGLAELSVKLQRAGDVTSEVANAYMTAVDKAYGFQGSIQSLTAAMDGANQIGNEYATNVGEIAAGIGKVASIAATGHVGIDELTAALGTITAVTQRSGTEAATALRAIFLNIMGDTTTEIEEGAKWTAGEIEGLSDVLKIYAPEVVAAAEATGSLVNPMEAIGALAKSYKAGILTESKLFSMVNDIGGKLRTNQLMVLIKNWDMYQSMLDTYANASGSIDREVENSLDSITVKTERLKASWVALVNDTVSTGLIKGVLDGLNTAVQSVGNLGNALTLVLGLVTALKAQRIATLLGGIGGGQNTAWVANTTNAIRGMGLAVAAIGTALSVANGMIQAHNQRLAESNKEALNTAQSASTSSQEIAKLYSTYLSATAGSEAYTAALTALGEALGLTATEAKNSEGSIRALTAAQLQQAAATAKGALDTWSYNQGETKTTISSWWQAVQASVKSAVAGDPSDLMTWIMTDAVQKRSAEAVVEAYASALEWKAKWDAEAREGGYKATEIPGYIQNNDFLSSLKSTYDEARALMDAYIETESNAAVYTMENLIGLFETERALASGKGFDVTKLSDYADAMFEVAKAYDDGTYTGGKLFEAVLNEMAQAFPNLIKYSKDYSDWMETSGADKTAQSASNAASSVNDLAVALSTATKAKQAFDAAMETEAENEGFANYQAAYAAYAEELEAGRVNSRRAMAAAQYLMAGSGWNFEEIYGTKGYAGVNAAMAKGPWKTIYGDADKTYGEGFLDYLGKIAKKNGDIVDSNGNVVASYKKVGNEVSLTVNDMLGLWRTTGVPLDQIWQSLQSIGVYGDVASTGVKEFVQNLVALGQAAGVTTKETGEVVVNYVEFMDAMKENGITQQEWDGMKQWLNLLNEIGMIQLTGAAEGWLEYADDMGDATEHATEDMQNLREAVKQGKEIAEESTPEALGLPVNVGEYDLSQVTEQTAAMNLVLGQMKEFSGAEKTNDFIAKMAESASQLGGKLEVVNDKIVGIKDAEGNDADWDFLAKVIEGTGEASAVLDAFGIKIQGLQGADFEVNFSVDPSGDAEVKLARLTAQAANVAVTREVRYNSDGTVHNIDTVRALIDGTARTRTIGWYADNNLQNASVIEEKADGVARFRKITYGTDGNIVNIEDIEKQGDGAARGRLITFSADGAITNIETVDGQLSGYENQDVFFHANADELVKELPTINSIADGPTTEFREIQYGANGNPLNAEVEIINDIGDGPTREKRNIKYGANLDELVNGTGDARSLVKDAGDAMDADAKTEFTAALDDLIAKKAEAEQQVRNFASGDYGKYNIDATTDKVWSAIEAAVSGINNSAVYDPINSYLLNASTDDVEAGVAAAQEIIGDSVETTNGTYILGVNIDGVKDGLAKVGAAYAELTEGAPVGTNVHTGILSSSTAQKLFEKSWLGNLAENANKIFGTTEPFDFWGKTPYVVNEPHSIWEMLQGTKAAWTPKAEVEFDADEESAKQAAIDAAATAGIALAENPVPLIPLSNAGDYDSYEQLENGDIVLTVTYETENEGVVDEIRTISAEDGKQHTITILTAGDGSQTITETVEEVDGLVSSVHTVTINADGTVETDLENIDDLIALVDRTASVSVYADTSSAQSKLNTLKNKLDSIKSKTVTVTTNTKSTGNDDLAKNAKGTDSFRGGLSLINEEGPELVAANGKASFYGGGLPTIAAIPRGAQIFTAEETAALLNGRKSLPAYAEGTQDYASFFGNLAKGSTGIIGGLMTALVTIPEKKKEEEEKKDSNNGSSGGGSQGSNDEDEDEFWNTIKEYIEYGLKKIQYQIDGYQDDITAIERARDAIIKPIQNELDDLDYSLQLLQYEVTLLERARDDAIDPLDEEIERLKKARDITKEDEALEEKKLAVEEARADLEEARHQRTVRYFNEESGQWEWMADQKAIQDAQDALEKAEEDYQDALEEYEITLLERERDALEEEYQKQIDDLEDREEVIERRQEDLEMEKTKVEHEYGESIEPLQDQLDSLQNVYDDLQKFYDRLVDAVEVPMDSLTDALTEMKGAAENYTAQIGSTIKLLDTLYELAPTWKAIDVGDLGAYTASKSTYGDYTLDQSTTVNIDGVSIEGKDADRIAEIIRRRQMYQSK